MVTATQLYNHLTCPHRVSMDAFGDPARRDNISPFVQLLWERGTRFEAETIAKLGQPFVNLSEFLGEEKERSTREAVAAGVPLIYSGRLTDGDLVGEPDLLRREGTGYAAIDIKSGAGEEGGDDESEDGRPKKRYGVQVALYTELLERLGVSSGRYAYIWDIHGVETRYSLDQPLGPKTPSIAQIYDQSKTEVRNALNHSAVTEPALASVCKLCVWRSECRRNLDESRDITLIAELGRSKRDTLKGTIDSVEALAAANLESYIDKGGKRTVFKGIGPGTLLKLKARATLLSTPGAEPYLTEELPALNGEPELFFDIETDPMRDRCYLHGFITRGGRDSATERYTYFFAEDITNESERDAFANAMTYFRSFPNSLMIHYAPFERTEFRKLQRKYPEVCSAEEVEGLFQEGRSFDLYTNGTRKRTEWPTNDYSVKTLARHAGFRWRDADPSGASSIEWFHRWIETRDLQIRQRILEYNEDDCRAMRVVLDAMRTMQVKAR